jgi:cysteine desulfuration protein SufE
MKIAEIREDFALLDDWEDRYRYVIELGRKLPDMPDTLKTDANKVRGCVSQVWLATAIRNGSGGNPSLHMQGDSDALIVKGLVAILFSMYNGRTANEILATDAVAEFASLGLKEHLTPQRSNGFASMVERIRSDAKRALAA